MKQAAVKQQMTSRLCGVAGDAARRYRLAQIMVAVTRGGSRADVLDIADELERLGLSCEEVLDLEIREPLASEITEYAAASGGGLRAFADAVSTVVQWHIQDIDRQIEMLNVRRSMLDRKSRAVLHLVDALSEMRSPRASI